MRIIKSSRVGAVSMGLNIVDDVVLLFRVLVAETDELLNL